MSSQVTANASPPQRPRVSIVVPVWDGLEVTRACLASVREHTDVACELIIVDNGSSHEVAAELEHLGDVVVRHETNLGFARGMNAGLERASGEFVVFLNNDTRVPPGWASTLLRDFVEFPSAGLVVPALSNAGRLLTVRSAPGEHVRVLPPFESWPSGVVFVMRADVARGLGGFSEHYETASGEDADLAYKVWVNDLDVVFDERVLVEHVGHATSRRKLGMRRSALWRRNRQVFLDTWADPTRPAPRLDSCPAERWERNRAAAAVVARWIQRHDRLDRAPWRRLGRAITRTVARLGR